MYRLTMCAMCSAEKAMCPAANYADLPPTA